MGLYVLEDIKFRVLHKGRKGGRKEGRKEGGKREKRQGGRKGQMRKEKGNQNLVSRKSMVS